ncbi:MAG: ATP-grasp domain-containing protein [Polaribacter sp.]
MKTYDVVILTDSRYTNPTVITAYIQNILDEDGMVKKALEQLGLRVLRLSWDDPNFDWSTTKSILFRTTWDYFDRFDEFSKWLNRVSQQTQLLNSEAIIRWNLDKHYLIDLAKKGVNICQTIFIEKGETKSLKELAIANNLTDFVIKPCISGAARETYHIKIEDVDNHEANFKKLIRQEAMMLQPFQHSVPVKGEVSYMVMNGKFTHAILKKAKPGDFRVQDDFGGTVHDCTPSLEEIKFAEFTASCCPKPPIYARVDAFTDNNGNLALAELELIEPELWFRHNSAAADELANGIQQRIIA